jgi:hypothetical protein
VNWLIDLDEILIGDDAVIGGRNVMTFNQIASTFLKLLGFKFVKWMHCLHHSALLDNELGLFGIAGFPWLHHMPSLSDVAMETKACTVWQKRHIGTDVTTATRACSLVSSKNDIKHCWLEV